MVTRGTFFRRFSRRKRREEISPPVTPCPDCGGRRARADGSYEMTLLEPRRGRAASRLAASVCVDCGRVFLYAVEIDRLRETFPESPEKTPETRHDR